MELTGFFKMLLYFFQHDGGIRTLKILVETAADTQYLVWEFQTKTDFWNHGQVKIEMGAEEFKARLKGVLIENSN